MKRSLIALIGLFSIAGMSFAGDTTITDGNLVFDYETPPGTLTASESEDSGNLNGDYWYRVTFYDNATGDETEMGTQSNKVEDV